MNSGKSAEKSYPGCLYAKSLLPDDSPGNEFQWYFRHPDIEPFVSEIDALRTSFSWEPGNRLEHKPIVVVETAASDSSLLVRFADAGKDKFGRDGTIRLEAMLVPNSDIATLIDGTFSAIPRKDEGIFLIRASDSTQGQLPRGSIGLFGRPGTFRLKSVGMDTQSLSSSVTMNGAECNARTVDRRKIRRAYLTTAISCFVTVIAIMMAIRLANAPDESKEELKETRRRVMELEASIAKAKEDMALQKKSFDDFIAQLKDIVKKAP